MFLYQVIALQQSQSFHTKVAKTICVMDSTHEDTTHLLPGVNNHDTTETIIAVNAQSDVIQPKHIPMQYNIGICCAFTISTGCMILLNKQIMMVFDFASLTLLIQNACLLIMLKTWKMELKFDFKIAYQWLPCSLLFCCNIFTSMQSLLFLSVPTFTVIRSVIVIFTYTLDWAARGTKLSPISILSLAVILGGVSVYHMNKWQSDFIGLCWAVVHVLSYTLYGVLVKIKINTLGLSAYEMSLYNGIWSSLTLIPLIVYQWFMLPQSIESMFSSCVGKLECVGSLSASGLCCCIVSVTGFIIHDIMSPVSFITFNNVNKLPATALSYVIWPAQVSYIELFGMAASMWGGYLYALSTHTKHLHWIWICTSGIILIGCISIICAAPFIE